jgi:hypothetical protein
MHRRGVGRLLLRVLAADAMSRGLSTFTLTVSPENRACLALTRSLSARFRFVDGVYEGSMSTSAILADVRWPVQLVPRPRSAPDRCQATR